MRKVGRSIGVSVVVLLLFAFSASCDRASAPRETTGVVSSVQPLSMVGPMNRLASRRANHRPSLLEIWRSNRRSSCPRPRTQQPAQAPCPPSEQPGEQPTRQPSEQPREENKPAGNPMGGCGICHIDVEDELFPTVHYKQKIGCIKCHGKSKAHLADENNEVAPDRLFTKKTIDKFCQKCHDCGRDEEAEQTEVHKICTQCHGAHTLTPPEKNADE